MTHMDRGHYARKHPSDRKVDQKIAAAIKERSSNEEIPCAEAFRIVNELDVPPHDVGFTIDFLETAIVKCQLGLFGYRPNKKIVEPADSVSPALEEAIREALVNDRLPCALAWEIAERLGLRKMEVSSACETLNIKISPCQLGSF